jgi:hypothetical protein
MRIRKGLGIRRGVRIRGIKGRNGDPLERIEGLAGIPSIGNADL